jgi:hypothetical protein
MTVPTPPPPPGVWRATTEAVTGAHQHSIVGCGGGGTRCAFAAF